MEPLVYVLAILGCADGGQLCERVRTEAVTFANKGACLAAIQERLPTYTDIDYPVVSARCETRGLQTASVARPRS